MSSNKEEIANHQGVSRLCSRNLSYAKKNYAKRISAPVKAGRRESRQVS
jgi:hypothetical protein